MALSRKLSKAASENKTVEELIMKGGTSGKPEPETAASDDEVKRVQLRIPMDKLDEIDKAVKTRPGKLSRHTWIMEAIEEKLKRDLI